MNIHILRHSLTGLVAVMTLAAAHAHAEDVEFGQSQVCIQTAQQTHQLSVELATTKEQRARGLMGRESLPRDSGMLFLYPHPQPASHGLWMYQTLIPLDAAFIDVSGKIVSIHSMDPCTSRNRGDCQVYRAGAEYLSALEVEQGVLKQLGIQVGDRVVEAPAGCPASKGGTEPVARQPQDAQQLRE